MEPPNSGKHWTPKDDEQLRLRIGRKEPQFKIGHALSSSIHIGYVGSRTQGPDRGEPPVTTVATIPVSEQWLEGTGGRIFTRHWEAEARPKANLVLCHGFNSHSGQYVRAAETF